MCIGVTTDKCMKCGVCCFISSLISAGWDQVTGMCVSGWLHVEKGGAGEKKREKEEDR